MEEYSFKRINYVLLSIAFFAILVLVSYLSKTSYFDLTYKILVSLYIVSIVIIATEVFFRHSLYYIFAKKNKMWVKEVDRPRAALTFLSILFMYLSFDAYKVNPKSTFYQCVSLAIYIASVVTLVICWSKKFKTTILPKISKIIGEPIPIIANTANMENERYTFVASKFNEKYISGNKDTIHKLLKQNTTLDKLEVIKEQDKLEWICQSGLNNNQLFNSQTLLSFISNLYNTEDSRVLVRLIENLFRKEYHISPKNISTWKVNKSKYLLAFESDFKTLISDRNPL